jgi:hypothetical protein
MVRDEVTVRIPNPHRGDTGVALLTRILRQAGGGVGTTLTSGLPVQQDASTLLASHSPSRRPLGPPGQLQLRGSSASGTHGTQRSRRPDPNWMPLLCPVCGGEMRIISFITLPSTTRCILLHLHLPHRPPRVSPARGPPQAEFDLDQSPAFDLAVPDPLPELPSLRSGDPAGCLLCSSSRGSARTGSSSISPRPRTGSSEPRSPPLPARPVLPPGRPPPPIRTSLGPPFPWRPPRPLAPVP